jgi:hypothetical protein
MGMIHKRGRNHWHSDGRPVGFGLPLLKEGQSLPRTRSGGMPLEGRRRTALEQLSRWSGIAISAFVTLYFAGQMLRPVLRWLQEWAL